jgi:uncharacterized protein YqgC (DUF456 family)
LAAVGHKLYFGNASVSNLFLVFLVLLTLCSLLFDYLATMFGARKLGATWRGLAGAVVGAAIGMFFGPFGILLGPFVGALAFELISGRGFSDSARAGAGAMLGFVLGAVGKVACCLAMIGVFTLNVIAHSGTTLQAAASSH